MKKLIILLLFCFNTCLLFCQTLCVEKIVYYDHGTFEPAVLKQNCTISITDKYLIIKSNKVRDTVYKLEKTNISFEYKIKNGKFVNIRKFDDKIYSIVVIDKDNQSWIVFSKT